MSRFLSKLIAEAADDCRTATLVNPLFYESDLLDDVVYVPAGFVTDFASVPRVLWGIIPPLGRYGAPAIIHDYLYRKQATDRKTADDVFLEAMEVQGCRLTQRWAIYGAVRMFGWAAWRSNKKQPTPV